MSRSVASSHVTRLPRLSSSVRSRLGSPSFSGTPGKPAPQPTSMTRLPENGTMRSSARQSAKCSFATACGSVMAVRFMTRFCSSRRAPKSHSCSACAAVSGTPSAAQESNRVCSILRYLPVNLNNNA